jgi:hypothetical protein
MGRPAGAPASLAFLRQSGFGPPSASSGVRSWREWPAGEPVMSWLPGAGADGTTIGGYLCTCDDCAGSDIRVSAGGEVVPVTRALLLDAGGADRDVEPEQVDLGQIGDQRLLWIDVGGGEEAERLARVLEPLGLPSRTLRYVVEPLGQPRLDAYGEAMHVAVTGLRPVGGGGTRRSS